MRKTVREKLDIYFNSEYPDNVDYYQLFKECLFCDNPDDLDIWMKGVIDSLFYKPNHHLLILEGDTSLSYALIEKLRSEDLNSCLDHRPCAQDSSIIYSDLFSVFSLQQKHLNKVNEDNFIILEDNVKNLIHPGTNKRLCSYIAVEEKWRYPQRVNDVRLELAGLDFQVIRSIEIDTMWRQIYKQFKPC